MAETGTNVVKKLAMAFLNATLLLVLALVISGIVLINKVQNFAGDTAAALREGIGAEVIEGLSESLATLERSVSQLQALDAELARSDAPTELTELRAELRLLTETVRELRLEVETSSAEAAQEFTARMAAAVAAAAGLAERLQRTPAPN